MGFEQLSLDAVRKQYRASDPFTSRKAAEKAAPRMGSDKAIVLEIFEHAPLDDLIGEELEHLAQQRGMHPGNAQKRLSDLARDGLVEWTGKTRPTSANKETKSWKLKKVMK